MAIVTLSPDSSSANQSTTLPQVLSAPSKSNFTTLFPEGSAATLLKYTEGYPWEVHYYGQILNTANSLTHVDPTIPTLLQPYYEARGLVIQVASPLSSSYDETTASTTVTGSAITPFGLKPNVGDLFMATVDTGEDAYFIITSVIRKTHRKDTLYEITYSLYKYSSADPAFVAGLQAKVQDTYYFNKEGKSLNKDVLITPTFKEAQDRCKRFMAQSTQMYLDMFIHPGMGTLILPGTQDIFYDPLILEFILKTVPHDKLAQTSLFNFTIADRYHQQNSILDLFMLRNHHLHSTVNKQYGFVSSLSIRNYSRFGTAFHAGVSNLLYPKTPSKRTDVDVLTRYSAVEEFTSGYLSVKNNTEPTLTIQTRNNDAVFQKRLLPSQFVNDYYIVSAGFYDYLNSTDAYDSVSFFEILLAKFIKREAIALEDLALLVENSHQWSLLQQFYLLPLVWSMMTNTI